MEPERTIVFRHEDGRRATLNDTSPLLAVRRTVSAAILLWTAGIGFDFLNAALVPNSLGTLVALRFFGTLAGGAVWLRLDSRRDISLAKARAWLLFMLIGATCLLALMGCAATGIASPYAGGAMTALALYSLAASRHWKRGLGEAALLMAAYPLTMLVAATCSPTIRHQLAETVTRNIFISNASNLVIAYVAAVAVGHGIWELRHQVFVARNLGRYRLIRQIGRGGMGEVWLARHIALKRDIAIKVLRANRFADTSDVVRFEREVRATTELLHPNTVRVFDYGVSDDGVWYYAMELLEGETLGKLIEREGAQAPRRAVHMILQATRAIEEAHSNGIVHRDVKPENLFVVSFRNEHDFIKVLDFGIAKMAAADGEVRLTRTGSFLGSPGWVAPEAILGDESDERADVYGLGAVLYFMLIGRAPFIGRTAPDILRAQLHKESCIGDLLPSFGVPHDLQKIVARCMVLEKSKRYMSATELRAALEEFQQAHGPWSREEATEAARRGAQYANATSNGSLDRRAETQSQNDKSLETISKHESHSSPIPK